MNYFKQLLKALQDIATNLKANQELEKKRILSLNVHTA